MCMMWAFLDCEAGKERMRGMGVSRRYKGRSGRRRPDLNSLHLTSRRAAGAHAERQRHARQRRALGAGSGFRVCTACAPHAR